MWKIAYLFPGQGSQEVGMASDLFKGDRWFDRLIETGAEATGEDLAAICLKGPERLLAHPRVLQPLIAAISLAYLKRLADAGLGPDCVLGHSLGEITALAAAGVVTETDAVRMAARRGQLMDDVAGAMAGGMLAALFMPLESVEALLAELDAADRIVVANDNAADQVVLSGDNEMLDRFAALVRERRLGRTTRVNVIGPWHSPYMRKARIAYEEWVASVPFTTPRVPVIMSATAEVETDPAIIKQLSVRQLTEPVQWRQSMESLKRRSIDTLVEIGPGRVLAGLARVNGFRGARIFSVNNLQGAERAVDALSKTATPGGTDVEVRAPAFDDGERRNAGMSAHTGVKERS